MDKKRLGKISKRRGYMAEKLLLEQLKAEGYTAYRTPASGGGKYVKGDIIVEYEGEKFNIEVKSRSNKKLISLIEFVNSKEAIYEYDKYLIYSNIDLFIKPDLRKFNPFGYPKLDYIFTSKLLDNLLETLKKSDILAIKNNDNKKNKWMFLKRREW